MKWGLVVLMAIASCHTNTTQKEVQHKPMPTGWFIGDDSLFTLLLQFRVEDSIYQLDKQYKDSTISSKGRWKINSLKHLLILDYNKPEQTRYFRVISKDSLQILDKHRNKIGGKFDKYLTQEYAD